MRRIALCLFLGVWALAIAQTPPSEEAVAVPDAPEQIPPCDAIDKAGAAEDELEETGLPAEPCVEPDPETIPDEDLLSAQALEEMDGDAMEIDGEIEGVIDENFLPTEASVEEEFEPDDEISEDYPVPLPSDI